MLKRICILCLFLITYPSFAKKSAPWVGSDFKGHRCEGKTQGYGPFDYTISSHRPKLSTITSNHFTPEVENLIRGKTGGLIGDLDYSLRAFPNHHKALLTIIKYQRAHNIKLKEAVKLPLKPAVECYFQRAINFSPKDSATYSLYGYYLRKSKKLNEATLYYEKALELSPENIKILYTYSLLLIDLKQYDKALEYAKKAYKLGSAPKELRNILKKLGVWEANQ